MVSDPVNRRHLALEPVEAVPTVDDKRALHLTTTDEFLAAAAKEYEEGSIDTGLWRKAVDQSHGDAPMVVAAYLRARASALKREQRQARRAQGQARQADAERSASDRTIESEPSQGRIAEIAAAGLRGVLRHKYLAGGAAAVLACVVVVMWLITAPRERLLPSPAVSAAVSAPSQSAPPAPLASGQPAASETNQAVLDPVEFEGKVQELKKTGNWNVLVLYAAEWTRKQPKNAAAWHQLGVGYTNLRQFSDALDASYKAVELAPEDASLWSDLGYLNLTVQRLPEAGTAFDRALALTPDHADALCGAAALAQKQGRPNDSDTFATRVKSANGECRGVSDIASAASLATASAVRRPLPSASR
jgi:tetratricopeptide (TPR) repeat protein